MTVISNIPPRKCLKRKVYKSLEEYQRPIFKRRLSGLLKNPEGLQHKTTPVKKERKKKKREGDRYLTSCAGMTRATHVREYLVRNCNIFSILSVSRYKPNKTNNNKFITSQRCNKVINFPVINFLLPVIYRRIRKEGELLRWSGHSLWSADQLAQEVKAESSLGEESFRESGRSQTKTFD